MLEELRRVQWMRSIEQSSIAHLEANVTDARSSARRAPRAARAMPWLQRRWLLTTRPWHHAVERAEAGLGQARQREKVGRLLEQHIAGELGKVRESVDAELAEGRGRRSVVAAMRSVPNRPHGVREYHGVAEFNAEDPRRALQHWPGVEDAGGMDFGYKWRLEDPVRRWNTTTWRVSWFWDSTHELYAIEYRHPRPETGPRMERVWLLGVLHDRQEVHHAVDELETYAQKERNSLIAVARAVADASARTPCSPSNDV